MPTPMSLQDIFDTGVRGVLKQRAPSIDPESGNCLYRGPNGLKCLIGHIIPDHWINEHFNADDLCLSTIIDRLKDGNIIEGWVSYGALNTLQQSHDYAQRDNPEAFVSSFKISCRSFAHTYGLSAAALDEVTA